MIKPIIVLGKSKFKKQRKNMRKEFYTKLNLENYLKKINEEVLYNIKNLMDKKIYLEELGYEFYCQFQIEVDTVDFEMENNDIMYEVFELAIVCTEDFTDNKNFHYNNFDWDYYNDKLEKSNIKKLFNFDDDFEILRGEDYFPKVAKEYHEVVINYIEKLYEMEKLKEKLKSKGTVEKKVKI